MSEIKADLKREETEMDGLVQEMMGHFCDELCRHPRYGLSQEELDQACAQCRMGEFRQRILDEYNRLNEFEKTQCAHLLVELSKERQKHRWVPASERLPDDGSSILICDEVGVIYRVDYEEKTDRDGNEIWIFVHGFGYVEAVAWMPLPDPYEPDLLREGMKEAGAGALAPAT